MSEGDGSSGTWGSWEVKHKVFVSADRTGGADSLKNEIASIIQQAGHEVINGEVSPDGENHGINGASDTTFFYVANGIDPDTIAEYHMESDSTGWRGPNKNATNCNIVVGWWTSGGGACTMANINKTPIFHAWDTYWSNNTLRAYTEKFKNAADIVSQLPNGGAVAGPDAQSLANGFLSGHGSGGAATGVNVVEGHIFSHEGETPQFWNSETYTPYYQIDFINFTMEDEYPRVRTATFETTENIDLTQGRVAVLIAGDCNDFGGIIIKKDYDSKKKIYKYQCQGFMERIMASPVYVVANGGHTAHHLISEYLASVGLPSVNLLEPDEYDVFIDEFTQEMLKAEADMEDSVENFNARNDTKIDTDKVTGYYGQKKEGEEESEESSESSDENSDNKVQQQETAGLIMTETESHDDDYEVINTFKAKPVGIYDKTTGADFIRTLIFDYGINVDFYGDINGIPHFDVMDMEQWKNTGWVISPEMGYSSDYERTFDITDVVTQVGVKNIQAINGNGELYTSKELLGVDLERFVGRMGTIVDNPNEKQGGAAQTDQIQSMYQDAEGNQYNESQVISTNGEPSCSHCKEANGGTQPEMKKYQKYWVNKCPGCGKGVGSESSDSSSSSSSSDSSGSSASSSSSSSSSTTSTGPLESKSEGHGKTVCKECKLEYCQFCGHCLSGNSYQLTEVTKITAVSGTTSAGTSTGVTAGSTSGSSGSSSGSSSRRSSGGSSSSAKAPSVTPGKSAKRRASEYNEAKKAEYDRMYRKTKSIMGH